MYLREARATSQPDVANFPVTGGQLIQSGWRARYENYFQRGADGGLGAGSSLDQFRAWRDAVIALAQIVDRRFRGASTAASPPRRSSSRLSSTHQRGTLSNSSFVISSYLLVPAR